jgi:hypothetical protein
MLIAVEKIIPPAPKGRRSDVMASTLTNLLFHIVFSTKNREPVITSPIRTDLYKYIGGIIRGEGGKLSRIMHGL